MKYKKINSKLFIKNRKNFINRMKNNSIAFFNSNDIYPVSADSTLPFEQHRDIFYLSGIDQEESVQEGGNEKSSGFPLNVPSHPWPRGLNCFNNFP